MGIQQTMRSATIERFPKYRVFENGDVYSYWGRNGYPVPYKLKLRTSRTGYPYVMLTNGEEKKIFKIHRLVAENFIDNPLGKKYVNHIDCDRTNYSLRNLEWVTGAENTNHSAKLGRMGKTKGEKVPTSKLNSKEVTEIIALKKRGVISRLIAPAYGVNKCTIDRISAGKTWKHLTGIGV